MLGVHNSVQRIVESLLVCVSGRSTTADLCRWAASRKERQKAGFPRSFRGFDRSAFVGCAVSWLVDRLIASLLRPVARRASRSVRSCSPTRRCSGLILVFSTPIRVDPPPLNFAVGQPLARGAERRGFLVPLVGLRVSRFVGCGVVSS
jgi:hypothetical protein